MTPTEAASLPHNPRNAVDLIQQMEPILAGIGYHCGLTGSVLFKGGSTDDTDIIIYAHQPKDTRPPAEVIAALAPIGLLHHFTTDTQYTGRAIEKCTYRGRYIDLFFLN
jgi:hypothetical protein